MTAGPGMIPDELALGDCKPATLQRQQRLHRAKWWFNQMRRAVESAVEWQPEPVAPAEQQWFAEARSKST